MVKNDSSVRMFDLDIGSSGSHSPREFSRMTLCACTWDDPARLRDMWRGADSLDQGALGQQGGLGHSSCLAVSCARGSLRDSEPCTLRIATLAAPPIVTPTPMGKGSMLPLHSIANSTTHIPHTSISNFRELGSYPQAGI